jgi:hypothetical protein
VGDSAAFDVEAPVQGGYEAPAPEPVQGRMAEGATAHVPLLHLAHARSGDKGDSANIAVFCRRPEYRDHLAAWLTPERVAAHFAGSVAGQVTRYEAPGLQAFNFVLEEALGGGGMASMRIDALGKAYGQRLLELQVPVPPAWANG